jgi:hypothetical protein
MNIEMNQEQNLQLQRILMNCPWREVSWIMDELEEKLAMDLVREDSMYEKAVDDATRVSKALAGRPRKVK